MSGPFELEWLGGHAEAAFHTHRGDRIDAFDWRLDTSAYTDVQRDAARTTWTISAHQEWCAAGGFTSLLHAMLVARAPVDLIGMAGRFVADEMVHVELACRMAGAWGGGVPLEVDARAVGPRADPTLDVLQAACALAIRVSCVGETFSQPLLAHALAGAQTTLERAVLDRIVRDEADHARVGWLLLDWAAPRLSRSDRLDLGRVAADAVDALQAGPARTEEWALRAQIVERRIRVPLGRRGVRM